MHVLIGAPCLRFSFFNPADLHSHQDLARDTKEHGFIVVHWDDLDFQIPKFVVCAQGCKNTCLQFAWLLPK